MNYTDYLNLRIENIPTDRLLTVKTLLKHFSIITYCVEEEKLRPHIPQRFDIQTIQRNQKSYGLVSAVTFVDKDFHFKKLFPYLKFEFPQTNYRAYIIDRETGENCAWFFGTALGSRWVYIPQKIWKMPWFLSKYHTQFDYRNRYQSYKVKIESPNASAFIDISEDNSPNFSTDDFGSQEEARFILTHPVTGYYYRSDRNLGQYQIWHPKMNIKTATAHQVYFEMFEKLGLLTSEEMQQPHSILLTNEIEFIIDLPPKKIIL